MTDTERASNVYQRKGRDLIVNSDVIAAMRTPTRPNKGLISTGSTNPFSIGYDRKGALHGLGTDPGSRSSPGKTGPLGHKGAGRWAALTKPQLGRPQKLM